MASSYNLDSRLDETLEALKVHYSASSKAEVLRKAIALLKVASTHENPDGSITLAQEGKNHTKVVLR